MHRLSFRCIQLVSRAARCGFPSTWIRIVTAFRPSHDLMAVVDRLVNYVAVICVGAFVFLGERMSKVQIFGSLMSLVGVVLLIHPPMIFGGTIHAPLQGVLCVLGASVCVSTVILTIRFLAARETTIVMTLWCDGMIFCLPNMTLRNISLLVWATASCALFLVPSIKKCTSLPPRPCELCA